MLYDLAMKKIFKILQAKAQIPKNQFFFTFFFDSVLLFFFFNIVYHFREFFVERGTGNIIVLLTLLIALAIFSLIFLRFIKRLLEALPYTYEIAHLFEKYVFLYEAIIFVILTFFLGINSSLLSLFEIEDNLLSFCLNASLIIASCIATATKATIDYAYASWDLNHRANGDELTNDENIGE